MSQISEENRRSTTPLRVGVATNTKTAFKKLACMCKSQDVFLAQFMSPWQIVVSAMAYMNAQEAPECCSSSHARMLDVLLCTHTFFTTPIMLFDALRRVKTHADLMSQVAILHVLNVWLKCPTNRVFFVDEDFLAAVEDFLDNSNLPVLSRWLKNEITVMASRYTSEWMRAMASTAAIEVSVVPVNDFYESTLALLSDYDAHTIAKCVHSVTWNAFFSVPLEEILRLHTADMEHCPHFMACRTLSMSISSWLGDTLFRAHAEGMDDYWSPRTAEQRAHTLERVASMLINVAINLHNMGNYEGVAMIHRAISERGDACKYLLRRCPATAADMFNIFTNVSRMNRDSTLVLDTMRSADSKNVPHVPNFRGLSNCARRLNRLLKCTSRAPVGPHSAKCRKTMLNTRVLEVIDSMVRMLHRARKRVGHENLQSSEFSAFVSVLACHRSDYSTPPCSPVDDKYLLVNPRVGITGFPVWKVEESMDGVEMMAAAENAVNTSSDGYTSDAEYFEGQQDLISAEEAEQFFVEHDHIRNINESSGNNNQNAMLRELESQLRDISLDDIQNKHANDD